MSSRCTFRTSLLALLAIVGFGLLGATVLEGCQTRQFQSATKNDNSGQEAAAQSAQTLFEVLERREVLAQKLKTGSCSTEPGLLNPASVAREVRLKASQLLVFGCLALPFWAFAATKDYHQELRVLGRGHASLEQVDRRYRELSTKLQGGQ